MEGQDQTNQFELQGEGLLVRAPAKINLSLLIAGKRSDGYHAIETVMAKINVYDEILIEPARSGTVSVVCRGPRWAPEGPDNLIYEAARRILDRCGSGQGLTLTLTKNLPAGSGLGSASSDTAATLLGVRQVLNLPISTEELAGIAADLGSDVPFFLGGPLAYCTGRGEKILPLHNPFNFKALVLLPAMHVSTAEVYRNYRHDPEQYARWHREICGLIAEDRIDSVTEMCANMLARSCFGLAGGLAELKSQVESTGIGPLCLSGSGSSMYCMLEVEDLSEVKDRLSRVRSRVVWDYLIVSNNRW